jgi:hypothetical protein
MRGFAVTVAAVSMLAAGAISAQADALQGGPIQKGNQCFVDSPMTGGPKSNGFGYWADCPKTASASVAATPSTPRVTRRHRATR